MVGTLTAQYYIKTEPSDTYRTQHKGGMGITGMKTKEGDYVAKVLYTSTHNTLLFFTNQGRVYRLKAAHIMQSGTRSSKGVPIINLIPTLNQDEKVTAVSYTHIDAADELPWVALGGRRFI